MFSGKTLQNWQDTYPNYIVFDKNATRMPVIAMLPDRVLHLLLDCHELLVVGQQVNQQRAHAGRRAPSALVAVRHEPLDALDQFVPEAVRRHSHLLQIFMSHFGQDVQGYLLAFEYVSKVRQAQT